MSVSSTTTKNSYSGNGSTTAFAYGFKIFADADLQVIIRASTGVETVKTLTTHYTVSNAGNDSGGNVTFTSGNTPASGQTVVIRRNLALTQSTDYVENDPFPAESHEDGLDRLTFIAQGIQEELDRSFKVSKTNSITTPEFVDDASTRASKLLGFSSDGNNLEATTGRVSSVTTSNVAVNGSGSSQAATVSFNSISGALALGIPVGSTGATGATGSGDVTGPGSATDNTAVRFDSTTGKLIQASGVTIDDSNNVGAASLTLTTDLAVAHGGTGGSTAAAARSNLGAAALGSNSDITALTGLTTDLSVAQGGTGASTHTAASVLVGAGTSAITSIAPSTSGNLLTSNGSAWTSAAPAGGGPTFATAVNPSSVASVTFTGIPSGVNTVTVGCYDLDFSASDIVEVQIGDSGGIETSGYVSSVGSQSESTNHTDAFVTQNSGMTTEARALFHLFRVDGNKWVYSAGASGNSQNNGSGMKLLSGELTQLMVKTGGGNNMSNGVIQISYQ